MKPELRYSFSIVVTKELQLLSVSLSSPQKLLEYFLNSKLNNIDRNLSIIEHIRQLDGPHYDCLDFEVFKKIAKEYKGDIDSVLDEFLIKTKFGYKINENSFICEHLKLRDNFSMLELLHRFIPNIEEKYVFLSDNVYSLAVGTEQCFLVENLRPFKFLQFSTPAFVELINQTNSFLESYNKGELLGLKPLGLACAEKFSIRIPKSGIYEDLV